MKVDLVRERVPEPAPLKEVVVHGPKPDDPILVIRQALPWGEVNIYVADDDGESVVAENLDRAWCGRLMDGIRELMAQMPTTRDGRGAWAEAQLSSNVARDVGYERQATA